MVSHGVLLAKEIVSYRPACGEAFLTPNTSEIMVFTHFFYSGFALPTSDFFRGLLELYGINIYHLNPKSILHIAVFIHLCEAFLGIQPHFVLFHHIFFLKPQPNKDDPYLVGGSGLQLTGTVFKKYLAFLSKPLKRAGIRASFTSKT